ncbi:MAG: F0F1 ATP synthase subunit epsilon [Muribaculaceae bacterium]|nr:F0F1 ATP synthase subunit epsilon [Muribaculaceae bacterium]MDE5845278.1 F0F1 ATP synthase subunit epsilon [Muribaculaceae bacterium]MDE5858415.1 F0F1 ATP synthase subunit epsilon [Muribaculaceae bacterium]MDE5970432.1 F0F1 ATP synthase subunit epsilon [Muribaculaceae bacterium]MDE6352964.1 F0F1 ATP synthase subunit epsilon [Muribaculaceae bacterium]
MTLKIISSQEIVYEGDAKSVTLPGGKGQFTVLDHHASLISTLVKGVISFTSAEGKRDIEIEEGIVDVDNNIVSVCIY